jgi:hypothetical protein
MFVKNSVGSPVQRFCPALDETAERKNANKQSSLAIETLRRHRARGSGHVIEQPPALTAGVYSQNAPFVTSKTFLSVSG